MAHLVEARSKETETETAMEGTEEEEEETGVDLTLISGSRAMVSPGEKEFDLLTTRMKDLMEAGRGECIIDVGIPVRKPILSNKLYNELTCLVPF